MTYLLHLYKVLALRLCCRCCFGEELDSFSLLCLTAEFLTMPKERRDCSPSSNSCRKSPYPCSSSRRAIRSSSKNPLEPVEDVKEWEETRCPVCMEHPHNAVLLLCSSYEKGCRPYMCDTSYRHSNCLDQFRKKIAETPTMPPQEESSHSSTDHQTRISEAMQRYLPDRILTGPSSVVPTLPCERQTPLKLMCPLCRGQIEGWVADEPARQFMNAKARSCACETCDYSGTYADLRKHARLEHPLVRPSEADPERQRDWRRMERERDIGDVLSTIHSAFGEERADDSALLSPHGSMLLIFFRVSLFESGASSTSWSSSSRLRGQSRVRRRTPMTPLLGEILEPETGTDAREGGNANDSSSSVPASPQRWRLPDDEL